jgi:tight adherence protein C
MEIVVAAAGAAAVALLVVGVAVFVRAPLSASAGDLLREREGRPRARREEGALVRGLLPPAPAFLIQGVDRKRVETLLDEAGTPYGFTVDEFVRFKVLVGALTSVLALLLVLGSDLLVIVLVVVGAAAGGYRLPDLWISSRLSGRVRDLERALPNMVDSLTLAMGAGMDTEAALRRVIPKLRGPIRETWDDVVAELNAGISLGGSLERLAARTRSEELGDLIGLIQQSRRLGVGLTDALRTRAEEMRGRRRLKAQEAAQRAPLKMMIPLVLFFLPALMIVFLSPAILSLFVSR